MRARLSAVVLLGVLSMASMAAAHPLSFGVMRLDERADGSFDLELRFSGDEDAPTAGAPRIDPRCRLDRPIDVPLDYGVQVRGILRCEGGLVGKAIGVEGLAGTGIEVPLTIRTRRGDLQTTVLDAATPMYTVPARSSRASVVREYLALGVEHIAIGVDHLLLVLLLLLGSRSVKQLLGTITSFTLGHSVTLALASLEIVHVPGPPVEACIALSLVLLAIDLARRADETDAASSRSPIWVLAVTFGLLHGLGFAGALEEVGLPHHAVVPALVGFNLGVEVGQVVFVALVTAATALARRLLAEPPRRRLARFVPAMVGAVSTYFLLDRLVALGS